MIFVEHRPTTNNLPPNARLLRLLARRRPLRNISRPATSPLARMPRQRNRLRNPNRRPLARRALPRPSPAGFRERVPGYFLEYIHLRGLAGAYARRHGRAVRVLGQYREYYGCGGG